MATVKTRRVATLVLLMMAPALMGSLGLRTNFDSRLLAAHNRERNAEGIPSLRWNPELAGAAATWARTLAQTGRFEHSSDPPGREPEGENLWAGTPGHFHPEVMVGLWISEKEHFKPGIFPDNSRTARVADVGHYTQVMWRDSSDVGCALARGKREEFLVCRYSQAGNVIGQTPF